MRIKTLAVAASVVASIGFGSGIAYGLISSTGSGTGAAATTSMQNVTIDSAAQSPNGALLPGATADLDFAVDNPNPTPMTVVSVVQNGTISVTGSSGCTLANSGVSFTAQTSLSVPVPANVTAYEIDLPTAMSMASSSADACQSASFSVPITITVQQG